MKTVTYNLKISPQGQLTLPRQLREQLQVQPGARVTVTATNAGQLRISSDIAMQKHFGTLPNLWTNSGQDAAEYTRELRNSMQPKQ